MREPGIIRPLAPSAYAQDIKTLAQQELRRLLRGTPAEQDLLGLLTAARGGLSGPDLAALTGEPLWEIKDVLHGVSGRTFTRRVSTWQPEAGPEVCLLGHEELQATATLAQASAAAAGVLARAGRHEQAATVARSIANPDSRAQALAAVAVALAELGRHEQAATVARFIANPDRQAQALAAVAEALAVRGETRQARHVASVACASGRWTTVLGLVLSLEPSAVRVLTDL